LPRGKGTSSKKLVRVSILAIRTTQKEEKKRKAQGGWEKKGGHKEGAAAKRQDKNIEVGPKK